MAAGRTIHGWYLACDRSYTEAAACEQQTTVPIWTLTSVSPNSVDTALLVSVVDVHAEKAIQRELPTCSSRIL